jgi:hypothetical protein
MSDKAKEITHPNGDQFTIEPLTPGRIFSVMKKIGRDGHVLKQGEGAVNDSETLMAFAFAVCREVLVDWRRSVNGSLVETTPKDREELMLSSDLLPPWVLAESRKIQTQLDERFKTDSGN